MFCLFMFTKCKQIIESSKQDMYADTNTYPSRCVPFLWMAAAIHLGITFFFSPFFFSFVRQFSFTLVFCFILLLVRENEGYEDSFEHITSFYGGRESASLSRLLRGKTKEKFTCCFGPETI